MTRRKLAIAVVVAFMLVGLGLWYWRPPMSLQPDDDATSAERLHRIGEAYEATTNRLGRPPHEINELRTTMSQLGYPAGNFISPIDHRPFVIIWDVDISTSPNNAVLAYEQLGVNGRRFVLAVAGIQLVNESELKNLGMPPGHPVPPAP